QRAVTQLVLGDRVRNCADRARGSIGAGPVLRMIRWRRIFKMTACRKYCSLERARIDPAAGKKRKTLFDSADPERVDPLNLLPLAQDQFGRTSADIQHQASFVDRAKRT